MKNSVTVEGKSYPVKTDFKVWLKFYEIINNEEIDSKSALDGIILCYKGGKLPPSFFKAFDALVDFFSGGTDRKGTGSGGKRVFDFSEDAELIFASFMSDYGIDLTKEEMHWYKFLALMKGLSGESAFMKVVAIRSINPAEIKDKKYRDEVIKKQRIFALSGEKDSDKFAENLLKVM